MQHFLKPKETKELIKNENTVHGLLYFGYLLLMEGGGDVRDRPK